MSEEEAQTYTAREIVLEFFPATDDKLVPGSESFQLKCQDNGNLLICNNQTEQELLLIPVKYTGQANTQMCCDLCSHSAPRQFLQMFRMEMPGSQGRRFRYISLCQNHEACDARRIDDGPIKALLALV